MQKTILLTGSTDGIGLETARTLVSPGHDVSQHGRACHNRTAWQTRTERNRIVDAVDAVLAEMMQ